ncbi:hypothetical protein [Fimbriimonas ginsengisoli]|nr:hypothetical protein [Fimbriimonas ginsengisoli]
MKTNRLIIATLFATLTAGALAQGFPGGPPQGGPPQGGLVRGGPGGRLLGGPGGGVSLDMLVGRPDVQADLQLSDDQKEQLAMLRESMRPPGGGPDSGPGGGPGGPPGGGGFGGPPPGGPGGFGGPGGPDSEEGRKAFEEMRKKNSAAIKKILSAAQLARLKGIAIQIAGYAAVNDADIQTDVALTDAQKAKIKALNQRAEEGKRAIFEKVRNEEIDPREVPSFMKRNQQILSDEIAKVLTDDQKAKLKSMEGKHFQPDEPRRGGGR